MQTQHFDIAQVMARTWVKQHTDPNEVAKALRYLRDHKSGPRFFRYLQTVVDEGRAVVRSGRTLDYYRQIEQVCRQHLSPYRDDPETMAQILGWAVRLMRYHRVEPNLPQPPKATPTRGEPRTVPATTERQRGRVKWFSDQKHYGFIQPDGGGDDVFIHVGGLAPGTTTLLSGQRVEFEIGKGAKGRPQAVNVSAIVQ
jgi:cold shock CspA family protein